MQAEYQTFIKIVAERAATANNAGERYALGSKSVDIPINQSLMAEFVNTINAQYGSKKYDVPADDVAAREFAVKHGLISETGATAGFIQCRITHPRYDNKAIINTGSTIQLAREIEAHLSLTINVLEKLQGKHEGFSAVKSEIFNKLNREILLEQMQWLINRMNIKEKSTYISAVENLDNQTLAKMTSILFDEYVKNDSSNITAFNQFMAGLRLNMADKFRNDMIHDLFIRGIIDPNNKKIDQQIKAIKSKIGRAHV